MEQGLAAMVKKHGMRNAVRIIAVWTTVQRERNVCMKHVLTDIVQLAAWSVMRSFAHFR